MGWGGGGGDLGRKSEIMFMCFNYCGFEFKYFFEWDVTPTDQKERNEYTFMNGNQTEIRFNHTQIVCVCVCSPWKALVDSLDQFQHSLHSHVCMHAHARTPARTHTLYYSDFNNVY